MDKDLSRRHLIREEPIGHGWSVDAGAAGWLNHPIEGMVNQRNPWFLQARSSSDGDNNAMLFCSLPPGGESLTGILTSGPFAAPERLKFLIAGHDGFPDGPHGRA